MGVGCFVTRLMTGGVFCFDGVGLTIRLGVGVTRSMGGRVGVTRSIGGAVGVGPGFCEQLAAASRCEL